MGILDGNVKDMAESGKKGDSFLLGTALYVIGLAVFGCFLLGVDFAFFPSEHPKSTGYVLLLVSVPAIFLTARGWATYITVYLALGIFQGIYLMMNRHMPSRPSVTYSFIDALLLTIYCLAGTILSQSFVDRKLSLIDRIALIAFLFSFAYGAIYNAIPAPSGPSAAANHFIAAVVMGCGLAALSAAWGWNRARQAASAKDAGVVKSLQ